VVVPTATCAKYYGEFFPDIAEIEINQTPIFPQTGIDLPF